MRPQDMEGALCGPSSPVWGRVLCLPFPCARRLRVNQRAAESFR